METKNNLKKGTKVGLIITTILICVGIINVVLSFLVPENRNEPNVFWHLIIDGVMYALVAIYALFGYKKAHGNMLRFIFFMFGVYVVVSAIIRDVNMVGAQENICHVMSGFATIMIGYIAGRLDRIEKNRFLMVIVGVFMLVARVIIFVAFPSNVIRFIGVMEQLIVWAAICLAYTARFEEHKAAGLADKADAKEN